MINSNYANEVKIAGTNGNGKCAELVYCSSKL